MAIVPYASKRGLSVTRAPTMLTSAIARPNNAPRSSSSTTGSSGTFAVRMNDHHDCGPFWMRDSRIAVRIEMPSKTNATPSRTMATDGRSMWCGWRSFSMPS